MSRYLRGLLVLLFALTCIPLFAQDDPNTTNPLYEPVSVVQRLSYDNFKNIKLLTVGIINYGGGEAEFNRLVDAYAEASSFYFSRDFKKAADAFTKNEKDINTVAMKLAEKYKQDAEALNKEVISHSVKARIKNSLAGKPVTTGDLTADKSLNQASEAIRKANDSYTRARPAQAIQLYRLSKDLMIQYYKAMGWEDKKIKEHFEKELADNRNKIYVSKEKKN